MTGVLAFVLGVIVGAALVFGLLAMALWRNR